MTGNEDETLIWPEENPTLKICLNCSTPQLTSQLREQEIEQLNCVFKLNYLAPFDSSSPVQVEELLLCQDCQQLLNHLYQLYNNFLQVSKVESYLTRQLAKLQEIIQSHQDKTIKCDLTVPEEESDLFFNQNDDDPSSPINCELIEAKVIVPLTSTLIVREPRVLLERLPSKYLNIKTPSHQNKEETKDDYLQFLPEIKIKVYDDYEDDDFIPHDDDSDYSEEFFRNSKSRKIKLKSPTKNPRQSTRTKKPKVEDNNYHLIKRIAKPTKKSSSQSKGKNEILRRAKYKGYRQKRLKYANPCWYCKLHFDSIDLLLDHTRQEHLLQSQTCSVDQLCDRCARICTGDASLATHLKKCELIPLGVTLPKEFMCHVCSKSFGRRDVLTNHLKTHSSGQPFPCDLCDYKAKYFSLLKTHKTIMHGNLSQSRCDECDVVCKNSYYLKLHKYRKHTQKGFARYKESQDAVAARQKEERRLKSLSVSTICEDCHLDFNSRLALINHRSNLHGDNLRPFVCDQCGQSFSLKRSLHSHLRYGHSDARPFLCQKCGKSYKYADGLRTHEKHTHSEEGRFKCNQLEREYNQRKKNIKAQLETKNLLPAVNNLSHIQNSTKEFLTSSSTTDMDPWASHC